jgi:predicted DCC family thiol-disulfide oxidoreductase YuxK
MGATVIFDGDCGFCQKSVNFALKHIKPEVTFVAYQVIDPTDFGLSITQCQTSLQFVSANRISYVAHNAVARMLLTAKFPWFIFGRLMLMPGVNKIMSYGYKLVAKNRHRLPGSTSACELDS